VTRDRRRLDPSRGDRTLRRPAPSQVRGGLHLIRRGLDQFRCGLGYFRRIPGYFRRGIDQVRRNSGFFRRGLTLPRPDPTLFRRGLTLFRRRLGFACRNFAGFDVDCGSLSIDFGLEKSFLDETRASLTWWRPTFTKADPSLTMSALDFTKDAGEVGNPARELAKSTRSCSSRERSRLPPMRSQPVSVRTEARTLQNYPAPQRKRSPIRCAIRLLARQHVSDALDRVAASRSALTCQTGTEARRGLRESDAGQSQPQRGFARGTTRQRMARRGPDPTGRPQTQPQRGLHDRVWIGTHSSGCRARLSLVGGWSAR
jgi:hypothetical protein